MSLESVFESKIAEFQRVCGGLKELVKDMERRAKELPNEIALLEKKKKVTQDDLAVATERAQSEVARIYASAKEVESIANGKMTVLIEERKLFEVEKAKTTQLAKSLDQQKAACEKLLTDLEKKHEVVNTKMAKLEELKRL